MARNAPVGDPDFGKLVRCPTCGPNKDAAYLSTYANLSDDMLNFRFSGYWRKSYVEYQDERGRTQRDYDAPLLAAQQVIDRRGWATFTGPNGLGKTYLLAATVNEARDRGMPAMYTTMAELLNVLRKEIKAGDDVRFDAMRRRLWECTILAIDEVDRFQQTDWTTSMLWELVDHREREWRKLGTLFATNNFACLPDYLQSRMISGRYALIDMRGGDVRPDLTR